MGRAPIGKATTSARLYREGLKLSVSEAAACAGLAGENAETRWRELERGRPITGPMVELLALQKATADALILLRQGRIEDARRALHRAMPAAIRRHVAAAAPGVEAIGPTNPSTTR